MVPFLANPVLLLACMCVVYIAAQPSFVITPRDKTVSRGQSVAVRCVVIGNPAPTTFWNALNTQVCNNVVIEYFLKQRIGAYNLNAEVTCVF